MQVLLHPDAHAPRGAHERGQDGGGSAVGVDVGGGDGGAAAAGAGLLRVPQAALPLFLQLAPDVRGSGGHPLLPAAGAGAGDHVPGHLPRGQTGRHTGGLLLQQPWGEVLCRSARINSVQFQVRGVYIRYLCFRKSRECASSCLPRLTNDVPIYCL